MERKTIIVLRNVLSNLYYLRDDSIVVIQDAGLRPASIKLSDKAVNNWNAILTFAESRGKINDLIEIALQEFPENKILREILETGKFKSTGAPEIDENLPWRVTASPRTLEKLMGKESTLLPISFLEVGLERSRSVARVKLADKSTGTGFLTSDNIFVTNNHVLENEEAAGSAIIQFNYQNTSTGRDQEPTNFELDPGSGFATSPSEEEDWTLVRVKGDANTGWGKIDLRVIENYDKIQYVNIIQHPAGGPKQIALYHNIVAYADENRFQYLTDTLEGSSGSPVFDNNWRVVALHHSGGNVIEPGTKKPVFRNEGININLVVKALESFSKKK